MLLCQGSPVECTPECFPGLRSTVSPGPLLLQLGRIHWTEPGTVDSSSVSRWLSFTTLLST